MKPVKMWAVIYPYDNHIIYKTLDWTRRDSIKCLEIMYDDKWAVLRAHGFKCIKITITEGWEAGKG